MFQQSDKPEADYPVIWEDSNENIFDYAVSPVHQSEKPEANWPFGWKALNSWVTYLRREIVLMIELEGDVQFEDFSYNILVNNDELEKSGGFYLSFTYFSKTCGEFLEKGSIKSLVIEDGDEKFLLYCISKQLDESFNFKDNSGKSIYNRFLANSRFQSQLELHDGSHTLLLTLREKKGGVTLRWDGNYELALNVATSSKDKGHLIFGEETASPHASTLYIASPSWHYVTEVVRAASINDLHQDSEEFISYIIKKELNSSFILLEDKGNLILKIIQSNSRFHTSRFHTQLMVFDRANKLLFKFQGKVIMVQQSEKLKAYCPINGTKLDARELLDFISNLISKENSRVIKDGNEELHLYSISKQLDESFNFNDKFGKSIYNLIPANSRFHSQLELHDGSHRLLLTFRQKIFTLRNTWEATGPSGKLFKVSNSHRLQSDSDLIVKVNKGGEKSGFDHKIRGGSKTCKSFFVYKGSSAQVVSKVVADASDMNKYLVEIDPKEDCDILKIIVFSVTAVVDARGRTGKKKANSFKFGGGVELYSYFAKNV